MPNLVLIIDPEDAFATALADTLSKRGVEVLITGDGKVGFDLAMRRVPSAIVVCVELPRMSGYSVCAKLKKDTALRDVPLILISGEATEEHFENHRKLKTRAEAYLKKPIAPSEVVKALAPYLGLAPTLQLPDEARKIVNLENSEDIAVPESPLPLAARTSFPDADSLLSEDLAAELPEASEDSFVASRIGAFELDIGASLGEHEEEEDSPTTVGQLPVPPPELQQVFESLEAKLRGVSDLVGRAKNERDSAATSEPRADSQVSPGTTTREMLALKRELGGRDREILELKERLHEKDKEAFIQREREMELETRLVHAEEERQELERVTLELRTRLDAADAKIHEASRVVAEARAAIEVSRAETREALEALSQKEVELTAVTSRETELREVHLKQAREDAAAWRMESERARGAEQASIGELSRLTNELSAATAEALGLRKQLTESRAEAAALNTEKKALDRDLADLQAELEATRVALGESEERVAVAFDRLRREEESQSKARQALQIALALLGSSGEPSDERLLLDEDAGFDEIHS